MSAPSDPGVLTNITTALGPASGILLGVVALGVGLGLITKVGPKAWRLVSRFF